MFSKKNTTASILITSLFYQQAAQAACPFNKHAMLWNEEEQQAAYYSVIYSQSLPTESLRFLLTENRNYLMKNVHNLNAKECMEYTMLINAMEQELYIDDIIESENTNLAHSGYPDALPH